MPSAAPDEATRLLLARLFWRASTPLVASLLWGGCAESAPAEALEQRLESLSPPTLTCSSGVWRPLSALKLPEPADFVALRSHVSSARPAFSQQDAAGVPCARAASPRLCEAELARVSMLQITSTAPHLVRTQADDVRAFETLEQKLTLLGKIDTPDEALLIAQHHGLPVNCSENQATQVRVRESGYRIATHTSAGCGLYRRVIADVSADGVFQQLEERTLGQACPPPPNPPPFNGGVAGRRPPNLLPGQSRRASATALGRYFARVARLEEASVPAFEQLSAELRALGAPRALREAARRAAEDEVRHTRLTQALAEAYGARPERPRLARQRLRGRAEVALDNALEGCVYETYAAYLATVQARLAQGSALAPALERIAADETAHAALSWSLARWLEPQLPASTRRAIEAARTHALLGLGRRAA